MVELLEQMPKAASEMVGMRRRIGFSRPLGPALADFLQPFGVALPDLAITPVLNSRGELVAAGVKAHMALLDYGITEPAVSIMAHVAALPPAAAGSCTESFTNYVVRRLRGDG